MFATHSWHDVCAYRNDKNGTQKVVECTTSIPYKVTDVIVFDNNASKKFGKKLAFICERGKR